MKVEENDDLLIKTASRNYNLDLMKILSCIAVVGLHTLQKDLSVVNSTLYYLCGFAVPTFFMASGYVLLNREAVNTKYRARKIISVLRIVVCWSIIVFFAQFSIDYLRDDLSGYTLLLLPELIIKGLVQKGTLWHFWYFGALMILYMCLPFLYNLREYLKQIWIGLTIFGFVIQIISYFVGLPLQSYCIQTFRLWTWLQYFILGGLIGGNSISRDSSRILNTSGRATSAFLLLITVWVIIFQNIVARFVIHDLHAEYFYDSIFTILWVALLFSFVMKIHCTKKSIVCIETIAPITMGVYILHPLVLKIAAHFITVDTLLESVVYFIAILWISSLVTLILSKILVIKRLIEL